MEYICVSKENFLEYSVSMKSVGKMCRQCFWSVYMKVKGWSTELVVNVRRGKGMDLGEMVSGIRWWGCGEARACRFIGWMQANALIVKWVSICFGLLGYIVFSPRVSTWGLFLCYGYKLKQVEECMSIGEPASVQDIGIMSVQVKMGIGIGKNTLRQRQGNVCGWLFCFRMYVN